MKKMLLIVLIMSVAIVLGGCGKTNEEQARDAVNNMLKALSTGNEDGFMSYVDDGVLRDQIRETIPSEVEEGQMTRVGVNLKRVVGHTMKAAYPKGLTYEIVSSELIVDDADTKTASKTSPRAKVIAKITTEAGEKTVTFIMKKMDSDWKADLTAMEKLSQQ